MTVVSKLRRLVVATSAVVGLSVVGASPASADHLSSFGQLRCDQSVVAQQGSVSTSSPDVATFQGPHNYNAWLPALYQWDGQQWVGPFYMDWAYKYDTSDTWRYYDNDQPADQQRSAASNGYYYAILNWVYDSGRQKWEQGVARDAFGSYYCLA